MKMHETQKNIFKGSEKTVLVDSADISMSYILLKQLSLKQLNYFIALHAEQDHSKKVL